MTHERAICIHGHFYQPPRENPWIEAIEIQDSAAPFHDWNERVAAECYAPNTAARILNGDGRIRRIINNYARMSFNIGPTLLSWMQAKAPAVYAAILEADEESRRRFSGHGSAIAQAYSHPILPLANERDKETQILWGFRDFEHRFGRTPEGMWLPETAVDVGTLEILASIGIRFVLLAPHQAKRVRAFKQTDWRDVSGGRVDPKVPYRLNLPSGQSIALFFYDGPIARDVSFGRLLEDGEAFHQRLVAAFNGASPDPQLVHVATDGEVYGHHRRFGEMALAYVLARLEDGGSARLTNYGEWLERHPPTAEVEIFENTSWSCTHGVERWRSDCGCNTGGHPDWNQAWRAPLRLALDRLRDRLAAHYADRGTRFLTDPWRARNGYIDVVLDRSPSSIDAFLSAQAERTLSDDERVEALKLLEMQRQAMLMYTSCGWFFDDLAGIEAVQVLRYAGRAIDLACDLFGEAFEEPFLKDLEAASSNDPSRGNGRRVYGNFVRPSIVDLPTVVAHRALTAPFSGDSADGLFSAYRLETLTHDERRKEQTFLGVGRAVVTFSLTAGRETIAYAAFHSGGADIVVGVRPSRSIDEEDAVSRSLMNSFDRAALDEVGARIRTEFRGRVYTLGLLLREEQERLLGVMMTQTIEEIESAYRRHFERTEPLLRLLVDLGIPLPQALKTLTSLMIHSNLEEAVATLPFDRNRVEALFCQATDWEIPLDRSALAARWGRGLAQAAQGLAKDEGESVETLRSAVAAVTSAQIHEIGVDLWSLQNAYYRLAERALPGARKRSSAGDRCAAEWLEMFAALGKRLAFDETSER